MYDQYLEYPNCINRLISEYREHRSLIVALDFDDTIYDFHGKGYDYSKVIHLVQRCNRNGFKIVIFSANKDHDLIKRHCDDIGIVIEGINKNILPQFDGSGKIYYNILLDDRAGLYTSYSLLTRVLDYVEGELNG